MDARITSHQLHSSTLQASHDEHSIQAKLQKQNDNSTQTGCPPQLQDVATETVMHEQNDSNTQTDLPQSNNTSLQTNPQQEMKHHLQDDFHLRSLALCMPKRTTLAHIRNRLTRMIQENKADAIIESLLFPVKPQDINIPVTVNEYTLVTVSKQQGGCTKLM